MYKTYAEARDSKGLNDAEVARRADVSAVTLTNWKHGRYTPKIDKLVKIANVVGIKPEELYAHD